MARRRSSLRNWLEYLPLRVALFALAVVPQFVSYPLVGGIGRVYLWLDGKRRRCALAGIRRAFPEMSARECRRIAFASAASFARIIVDVARMPSVLRAGRSVSSWVDSSELETHIERFRGARGDRPVVLCTPHLGSWEAAITAAALLLNPLHLIGRRMENPRIDKLLFASRSRFGQKVYQKKGGIRPLAKALARGESVAFAADQNQRRGKAFVEFFGELASCDRGPIRLAEQFDAPIVIGAAIRVGKGFRFKVVVADSYLLRSAEGPSEGPDAEEGLVRLHRGFEELVRRHPEQYLWMHDRWRTRPREESDEGA